MGKKTCATCGCTNVERQQRRAKKLKAVRPGHAVSGYMLFVRSIKVKVKAENPTLGPKDHLRIWAQMWSTKTVAEKTEWRTKFKEQRQRSLDEQAKHLADVLETAPDSDTVVV